MAKSERRSAAVSETIEPLLSYRQMADELGIPVRRLRDLVYTGVVPHFRLSYKCVVFQRSRVLKALLKREVKEIGT
jgi:hypothetical protein